MTLKCLFLVLVLTTSPFVRAQQALNGTITLRDAIDATLAAHPTLRSFPLRAEALLGERETANLKPSLRVNSDIESVLGTGGLSGISGAELTLSLSQVVEMGDKRSFRVNAVNRKFDLLNTERKVTELDLLGEVVSRFIDVANAQEQQTLQEQATAISSQTIALLTPLVDAGQTPQLELNRAQAALIRAQSAEQAASTYLESSLLRLANMWANNNPQFEGVSSEFLAVGQANSIASFLADLESNPNVEIFADESRLLEAELRQAQARQQNDIEWSAGVRHLREFNDTGFVFGVSIPLMSKSRASGEIRTARARLQEVEIRRATNLNRLIGEISSLHKQLQQAIAEVNSLQADVIPLLESAMQDTRQAYLAGTYSYLELISAQREYLDAQFSLINSATNAHKFRAEIERLSGQPLSPR